MKTIVAREIIEAKIVKDYTVEVVFDDFKRGTVDLHKFLGKGIFKNLLDKKRFHQMKVDAELGTICWPNGADIAPDRLYSEVKDVVKNSENKFERKYRMQNLVITFVLVGEILAGEAVLTTKECDSKVDQYIQVHTHSENSSQGLAFGATLTKPITVTTSTISFVYQECFKIGDSFYYIARS